MKKRTKLFSALLLVGCFSLNSFADDLNVDIKKLAGDTGAQANFESLSKELGNTIRLTALSPAEPLGILGFDVGVEASFVNIDEDAAFWKVVPSKPPSVIPFPRLRVAKGLPLDLDVGVAYAAIPSSNIKNLGAEIKWSPLAGGVAYPAVAIRGAFSTLMGVDNLDINNFNMDIYVSKGVLFLTPFGGVSRHWTKATPKDIPGLESVSLQQTRGFVGLKTSLGFIALTIQGDFPEPALYSAKLSINF